MRLINALVTILCWPTRMWLALWNKAAGPCLPPTDDSPIKLPKRRAPKKPTKKGRHE